MKRFKNKYMKNSFEKRVAFFISVISLLELTISNYCMQQINVNDHENQIFCLDITIY